MAAPGSKVDYTVDFKGEGLIPDLKKVTREICEWKDAEDDAIEVKKIGGGITNLLYRLTFKDHAVLVRVFGEKTEVMIDREVDNANFQGLSDRKFGPHYYGQFANGRVEGWLEARPLEPPEMGQGEFPAMIATQLAKMHSLAMPGETTPQLWQSLDKWFTMAEECKFDDDPVKAGKCAGLDLPQLRKEMDWLRTVLPSDKNNYGADLLAASADKPKAEVAAMKVAFESVFCHNDLLSGNILHPKDSDRVHVIDFEYGGYNFAGFDFGNHFCEYAGFDFDLKKWYPDLKAQSTFFRAYLKERSPETLGAFDEEGQAALLAALRSIANQFALASGFYWGLWAVIQARYSPIDFDFMQYAVDRFNGFKLQKGEFFPGVEGK